MYGLNTNRRTKAFQNSSNRKEFSADTQKHPENHVIAWVSRCIYVLNNCTKTPCETVRLSIYVVS